MEGLTKPSQFNKTPESKMRSLIKEKAEQKPFESPAVQSFFKKWCEINSSIEPEIIDRHNWEQKDKEEILKKGPDGKQTLFVPEDLQLWEMVGVMEVVDYDTFAAKPKRQDEKKKELLALGKTFRNTGVYVSQRLDFIDQGKEIARALAEEFYEYGESLLSGKKTKEEIIADKIAENYLSLTEIAQIDRFLAGDNLYASRQARAEKASQTEPEKREELYEQERRKTLAQFFRVWEGAFLRQQETKDRKLSYISQNFKHWQSDTSIHSAFLRKVEKVMVKQIETPKRELESAIFRRGLQKLVGETKKRKRECVISSLFKETKIDLSVEEKKLADALNISRLKTELETIRRTGDFIAIGKKEREITDKIQSAVSLFPRKSLGNNPSEIVVNQYINCLGASLLGGAFLSEVGIKYLVGSVFEHSILVVITSDGKIGWRDMITRDFNEEITDEMIDKKTKDGRPLTVADIIAYANNPKSEGLMLNIKDDAKLSWFKNGQSKSLTLFPPEIGQQIQLLENTGFVLYELGRYKEAIEAYQRAIALDPKCAYFYHALGNAFYELGRYKEAIEAYRKFIALADKEEDDYFIKRAERIILELSND